MAHLGVLMSALKADALGSVPLVFTELLGFFEVVIEGPVCESGMGCCWAADCRTCLLSMLPTEVLLLFELRLLTSFCLLALL